MTISAQWIMSMNRPRWQKAWVLFGHAKGEAQAGRAYPALRAADLANTWAYIRSHREEIERQITDNEAA